MYDELGSWELTYTTLITMAKLVLILAGFSHVLEALLSLHVASEEPLEDVLVLDRPKTRLGMCNALASLLGALKSSVLFWTATLEPRA